jgi:hypothetical protein
MDCSNSYLDLCAIFIGQNNYTQLQNRKRKVAGKKEEEDCGQGGATCACISRDLGDLRIFPF